MLSMIEQALCIFPQPVTCVSKGKEVGVRVGMEMVIMFYYGRRHVQEGRH